MGGREKSSSIVFYLGRLLVNGEMGGGEGVGAHTLLRVTHTSLYSGVKVPKKNDAATVAKLLIARSKRGIKVTFGLHRGGGCRSVATNKE